MSTPSDQEHLISTPSDQEHLISTPQIRNICVFINPSSPVLGGFDVQFPVLLVLCNPDQEQADLDEIEKMLDLVPMVTWFPC